MNYLEHIIYLSIILISGRHSNPAPLDELNVNMNIAASELSKDINRNGNDYYFGGYQKYEHGNKIRPIHRVYKTKMKRYVYKLRNPIKYGKNFIRYKYKHWTGRFGKLKNNALTTAPSPVLTSAPTSAKSYKGEIHGNSQEMTGKSEKMYGNSQEISGKSGEIYGSSQVIAGKSGEMYGNSQEISGKSGEIYGSSQVITGKSGEMYGNRQEISGKSGQIYGSSQVITGKSGEMYGNNQKDPFCTPIEEFYTSGNYNQGHWNGNCIEINCIGPNGPKQYDHLGNCLCNCGTWEITGKSGEITGNSKEIYGNNQ